MKYLVFLSLVLVSFLFTFESWGLEFKAGAAVESLNPPKGISLAGFGGGPRRHWLGKQNKYAHYLKASLGVHDDVRAKAIVLKFGAEKMAIVSLDLVAAPSELRQEVAKRVSDIGLDAKHLLITATHTHSGPGAFAHSKIWEILAVDKFVPEVLDTFVGAVERAIRRANSQLTEAKMGVAQQTILDVTYNRRKSPDLDPVLTLWKVESVEGEPIGNILNFPIHGTVLGTKNLYLSADVAGSMEHFVSQNTGGVSIFINGAEGDVGPKKEEGSFSGMEALGAKIAQPVIELWQNLPTNGVDQFKLIETVEPIGRAQLNVMACLNYNKASGTVMAKLSKSLTTNAVLSGFVVNGHAFVTIPGEPITKLGVSIKEKGNHLGFKTTSIFGLTNDHLGYIVDEVEFKKGGYEACGCMYGPHLGEKILKASEKILTDLATVSP